MADVFATGDAVNLLRGKKILYFGDSNMRALYKDVLCLLTANRLITEKELKGKVEKSFLGDTLMRGSPLTKGRSFKEDRLYQHGCFHIEFHFITKCFNDDIESIFHKVKDRKMSPPDIIIFNSTLWDVVRWGVNGVDKFKDNVSKLLRLFQSSLPKNSQVIWVTAPPISAESFGGFLIQQIEFTKYTMRFDVMEANMFVHQLILSYGYDLIDFHYHLRMLVHWRNKDGIHWSSKAMRHLTNLVLTHVSLAWGIPLPGNFSTSELTKYKEFIVDQPTPVVKFPKVPLLGDAPYPEQAFNINVLNPGRSSKQSLISSKSRKRKNHSRIVYSEGPDSSSNNFLPRQTWNHNHNGSDVGPQGSNYNNVEANGNWSDDFDIQGPSFTFSKESVQNLWHESSNQPHFNDFSQPPHHFVVQNEQYRQNNQQQLHRNYGPVRSNFHHNQSRYAPY